MKQNAAIHRPHPERRRMELTPEQVVRDHAPKVYSLAFRLLGNAADAEDVTQDVLLQVVRKLDTFRGEAALPTWLYRITVNAALAFRRKRAAQQAHLSDASPDEITEEDGGHGPLHRWSLTPEQEALDQETRQKIEAAIDRLPDAYRDIYVLADVEQIPNQEIADMLGLSESAVKNRLHRARLRMRRALASHFQEAHA
jgi:RNA polymerase sigma-70 factor (ECF subfamily)